MAAVALSRTELETAEEKAVDSQSAEFDAARTDMLNGERLLKDRAMKIPLPPPIDSSISFPGSNERFFFVPDGVAQAEQQFLRRLPQLMVSHHHQWVYVTNTGEWSAFESQDDAQLGAELAGYPIDTIVVRCVSG